MKPRRKARERAGRGRWRRKEKTARGKEVGAERSEACAEPSRRRGCEKDASATHTTPDDERTRSGRADGGGRNAREGACGGGGAGGRLGPPHWQLRTIIPRRRSRKSRRRRTLTRLVQGVDGRPSSLREWGQSRQQHGQDRRAGRIGEEVDRPVVRQSHDRPYHAGPPRSIGRLPSRTLGEPGLRIVLEARQLGGDPRLSSSLDHSSAEGGVLSLRPGCGPTVHPCPEHRSRNAGSLGGGARIRPSPDIRHDGALHVRRQNHSSTTHTTAPFRNIPANPTAQNHAKTPTKPKNRLIPLIRSCGSLYMRPSDGQDDTVLSFRLAFPCPMLEYTCASSSLTCK